MTLNNSLLTLLLWIFLSITEIIKTYTILKIFNNDPYYTKKEVYIATCVVNISIAIISFFLGISYETSGIIQSLVVISSPILAIVDSFSNRIFLTVSIYIIDASLNSIVDTVLMHFFHFQAEINNLIIFLFIQLILILVYYAKYHSTIMNNILNKHGLTFIKIFLIANAFLLCSAAGSLYKLNPQNIFLSDLSFICVMILCSLTWYILNIHKKITELSAQQEVLLTAQKEYYITLLEKEEETRQYRHDMNNHLMCLSVLLNKNDTSALKEYLDSLQDEFKSANTKVYQTGNTIITAITAHYLHMVDDNTKVNISGKFTKELALSNTDLCTIYSNLIKNAIEELGRIDKSINKELNIKFENGNNFGRIFISNSMKDASAFKGLASKTVKKDKKNHGYGIQNINRTVAKNNGKFNIKKENDQFCCEVIFPIKLSTAEI